MGTLKRLRLHLPISSQIRFRQSSLLRRSQFRLFYSLTTRQLSTSVTTPYFIREHLMWTDCITASELGWNKELLPCKKSLQDWIMLIFTPSAHHQRPLSKIGHKWVSTARQTTPTTRPTNCRRHLPAHLESTRCSFKSFPSLSFSSRSQFRRQ